MSQSRVVHNYRGYEIVIIKEGLYWNAYLNNISNGTVICEKIVANTIRCDETIQKAEEYIGIEEWKLIANYDPLSVYVRQNANDLFDYKIMLGKTIVEMGSNFEDEKGLAFARAIAMAEKY